MKVLFTVCGKVRVGADRGKALGFPTANIPSGKKYPEGIYASEVAFDGKSYQAATFIGVAKTFDEKGFKVESFIFNFDKDIYGRRISVKVYKLIRKNKKFKSSDELIVQMEKDVKKIKEFFNRNSEVLL